VDWDAHAEREEGRYADGLDRLPDESDARQKQLVRMAMAATGSGLVRLMQGRRAEAAGWFTRSAERFRESYGEAPPGSWGRLIGAVKARLLAGDWEAAGADATWALEQGPADVESPIGRYAATLALLVLGRDDDAVATSSALLDAAEDAFPRAVAESLAALATGDGAGYRDAAARVLESFESRDEYLEGIPVADTVIVLQALAERRGIAAELRSPLLPEAAES
jgi:tetratricopeptide (TPR) repeat protein